MKTVRHRRLGWKYNTKGMSSCSSCVGRCRGIPTGLEHKWRSSDLDTISDDCILGPEGQISNVLTCILKGKTSLFGKRFPPCVWLGHRLQKAHVKYRVKWKSLSRVWLFVTPWTIQSMEFSRQNTGVGSLSLLQGIFPTQGSNLGLPHCRLILYQLRHKGSPKYRVKLITSHEPHPQWLDYIIPIKQKSRELHWT